MIISSQQSEDMYKVVGQNLCHSKEILAEKEVSCIMGPTWPSFPDLHLDSFNYE